MSTTTALGAMRRRWNAIGGWFFASMVTASVAYVLLAVAVTVRGGLSPAAVMASLAVLGLEVTALVIAVPTRSRRAMSPAAPARTGRCRP